MIHQDNICMNVLNIPGLNNSGPDHWQSIWEQTYSRQFKRVQQQNWVSPNRHDWVDGLNKYIRPLQEPVVLVAHSLGCIALAHWANQSVSEHIAGALLVAPADVEQSRQACFKTFCPVPLQSFPFPSIVVASTNDPYISIEKASRWAGHWGSKFTCVGEKGHINADSGLWDWNEGLAILSAFTVAYKRIQDDQTAGN